MRRILEVLLAPLGWLWRWHERRTLPEVIIYDGVDEREVVKELLEEDAKFIGDALTKMAHLMSRETEICFRCGSQVRSLEQVVHAVYARPCGCRLWQGTVPAAWQSSNS